MFDTRDEPVDLSEEARADLQARTLAEIDRQLADAAEIEKTISSEPDAEQRAALEKKAKDARADAEILTHCIEISGEFQQIGAKLDDAVQIMDRCLWHTGQCLHLPHASRRVLGGRPSPGA